MAMANVSNGGSGTAITRNTAGKGILALSYVASSSCLIRAIMAVDNSPLSCDFTPYATAFFGGAFSRH